MEFPTTISLSSPFPISGVLGVSSEVSVSDLDLHCVSMSHKKYARVICVKILMSFIHQSKQVMDAQITVSMK